MLEKCKFLALSGGGINGIMQIGALKFIDIYLRRVKGKSIYNHFDGFAGTSIGALIALLCALNLSPDKMVELFENNLKKFSLTSASTTFFSKYRAIRDQKPFVDIIKQILLDNCEDSYITFSELYEKTNKDLVITATNVCTSKVKFFRHATTPHVHVLAAVIASMAIPFVFPAVVIKEMSYVDGGCMINFPIMAFPIKEVLGLWILSNRGESQVKSFQAYTVQVTKCLFFAQDELLYHLLADFNTIIQLRATKFPYPFENNFPIAEQLLSGALHVFFHTRAHESAVEILTLFLIFMASRYSKDREGPLL